MASVNLSNQISTTTKDTIQIQYLLQYLLQVVEQHWKLFTEGN